MKVLVITGDRRFGPGHPRFELQRSAVDNLTVVYWGRGNWWPKIPAGHFEVVTGQDPFLRGHLAGHIAQWKGARLNIQVHTDLDAQSWIRRIFARIQLRHADSIRVVSEKIKRQVELLGVKAPVVVLPVYLDVQKFSAIVRQPHDGKTILWVGRFEDEKDPLKALEILRRVRAHGMDANLVMLGAGSIESALRAAAEGLPVKFPGWNDPRAYLQVADAVVCTSKHESWGESIIEALAAGVPVVSPDVGVAKEAGAKVVSRDELADGVLEVLKSGERGKLLITLLSAEEWARQWKESL